MKNEYYGNNISSDGYNIEFYKPSDNFSARVLNRPIRENYEDIESIYEVLQNLCKTIYGQKINGILPDVYEEMNKDTITTGYFFNNETNYIRIPTGAFFAKLDDEQAKYYATSYKESNQYSRDFYIDNDRNAAVIFNRPNVELFERQVAEHFNIDLNDQDSDIKLFFETYTDEHISNLNSDRTEKEIYLDIEKKYTRTQKIKYHMEFTNTTYDYKKRTDGNTVLTNSIKTNRIPINSSQYCSNVFDLVKNIKSIYGNYLMKEDDEFSLEELIPIDNSKDSKNFFNWVDGNYIIFFNPNTKNITSEIDITEEDNSVSRKSIVTYSKSKRFGMMNADDFDTCFGTNNFKFIKLFKVKLEFEESVNNIRRCNVNELETVGYLNKIDRTTLDIKNINLTNGLNGLIIEKNNQTDADGNINIGEAHILPEDDEKDNISIGLRNLGYPKLKDGSNQDPEVLSQRYKKILGTNNISLGTNSMRNTSKDENNNKPKNNIAIGTDALINVGYGKNNIEIGNGNGKTYNTDSIINIGDNLTAVSDEAPINFGSENVIVGYGNIKKTYKIGSSNTVLGLNNNSESRLSMDDNNVVLGNDNKFSTIISDNIVIGHNPKELSFGSNNSIIGTDNEFTSDDNSKNNYLIGFKNSKLSIGNNNYTFGFENNNTGSDLNFAIGSSNTNNGLKNLVVGNYNDSDGTTNIVLGNNNILNTESSNNYCIGSSNKIFDDKEVVIGIGNISSVILKEDSIDIPEDYKGNEIFGSYNISAGENNDVVGVGNIVNSNLNSVLGDNNNITGNGNIIIANDKTISKNNSIIIGCDSTNVNYITGDNQMIIGPLKGTKYFNSGVKITETTELFDSSSTFNVDGNSGTVSARFINMNIQANSITHTGNLDVQFGKINSGRFLSQDKYGKTMWINGDDEYTTGDESTLGVPVAGRQIVENNSDSNTSIKTTLKNYKTFIGNVHKDGAEGSAFDIISIRENNGKGASYNTTATMGSVIYIDRRDGRMYTATQNGENGAWDKSYSAAITNSTAHLKEANSTKTTDSDPRQIIDTVGKQTIEGLMTFNGSIYCPESKEKLGTSAKLHNGLEVKGDFEISSKTNEDNNFTINNKTYITNTLTVGKPNSEPVIVVNPDLSNLSTTIKGNKLTIETPNISSSSEYIKFKSSNDFAIESGKTELYSINGNTDIASSGITKISHISVANNKDDSYTYGDGSNDYITIEQNKINLKSTSITSNSTNTTINSTSKTQITASKLTTSFGDSGYCFKTSGNGYIGGTLIASGDITANSFIATSARNQKKNIVPTKHNAVEEINKVEIVDFNFKTDTNNENAKVGFIADDTDKIFSTKTKDKMDLYNCVGMLMKAVQELSAENKKLKERILKLEK